VVTDSSFVLKYASDDKPKGIWAFKVNADDTADEVVVQDIEYAKTRTGKISIVARIPPTRMDGVVVERVTVHNAAWMLERNIGIGSVIKVLRSGGVIPKIVDVLEPGEFKAPPWPSRQEGRFFVVDTPKNGIGTTFVVQDKDIAIAQIRFFVTTLGIELLAEKTIEKLYDVGLCSAVDYINLVRSEPELRAKLLSSGLGDGQAANIIAELSRVLLQPISLKTLMVQAVIARRLWSVDGWVDDYVRGRNQGYTPADRRMVGQDDYCSDCWRSSFQAMARSSQRRDHDGW
jgi:NAD-dependent DNA ligase